MAPEDMAATIDTKGIANTSRVVRTQLFTRESGVVQIKSVDAKHMPGRISVGDISADGFPDILLTVRYDNGTDES